MMTPPLRYLLLILALVACTRTVQSSTLLTATSEGADHGVRGAQGGSNNPHLRQRRLKGNNEHDNENNNINRENIDLIEPPPGICASFNQSDVQDRSQHTLTDEECVANACIGGCCRIYTWLICDEDNAFDHLQCICNENTKPTPPPTPAPITPYPTTPVPVATPDPVDATEGDREGAPSNNLIETTTPPPATLALAPWEQCAQGSPFHATAASATCFHAEDCLEPNECCIRGFCLCGDARDLPSECVPSRPGSPSLTPVLAVMPVPMGAPTLPAGNAIEADREDVPGNNLIETTTPPPVTPAPVMPAPVPISPTSVPPTRAPQPVAPVPPWEQCAKGSPFHETAVSATCFHAEDCLEPNECCIRGFCLCGNAHDLTSACVPSRPGAPSLTPMLVVTPAPVVPMVAEDIPGNSLIETTLAPITPALLPPTLAPQPVDPVAPWDQCAQGSPFHETAVAATCFYAEDCLEQNECCIRGFCICGDAGDLTTECVPSRPGAPTMVPITPTPSTPPMLVLTPAPVVPLDQEAVPANDLMETAAPHPVTPPPVMLAPVTPAPQTVVPVTPDFSQALETEESVLAPWEQCAQGSPYHALADTGACFYSEDCLEQNECCIHNFCLCAEADDSTSECVPSRPPTPSMVPTTPVPVATSAPVVPLDQENVPADDLIETTTPPPVTPPPVTSARVTPYPLPPTPAPQTVAPVSVAPWELCAQGSPYHDTADSGACFYAEDCPGQDECCISSFCLCANPEGTTDECVPSRFN